MGYEAHLKLVFIYGSVIALNHDEVKTAAEWLLKVVRKKLVKKC